MNLPNDFQGFPAGDKLVTHAAAVPEPARMSSISKNALPVRRMFHKVRHGGDQKGGDGGVAAFEAALLSRQETAPSPRVETDLLESGSVTNWGSVSLSRLPPQAVPERDATNGRRGGDGSRKLVLERFLQGAKRGDVRALQEIAEAEPGVIDARNIDKYTALLTAAEEGQAESVRALLALGAGVNCGDRNRETALYKAAKAGRAEAADVLIRVGKADVNKLSAFGSTPLHEAAVRGHTHIVELLLRHGASHSLKDHEGVTPLEAAAAENKHEVVKLLVDAGAEVNIQDKDGLSPLMVASYEGHVDVVRALLAKGARHDATNRNGHTPLHFAYANNKPQVIELLLQAGARADVRDTAGHKPAELLPNVAKPVFVVGPRRLSITKSEIRGRARSRSCTGSEAISPTAAAPTSPLASSVYSRVISPQALMSSGACAVSPPSTPLLSPTAVGITSPSNLTSPKTSVTTLPALKKTSSH